MIKEYRQICDVCGKWFDIDIDDQNIDITKIQCICTKCLQPDHNTDEVYDEQYWWEN